VYSDVVVAGDVDLEEDLGLVVAGIATGVLFCLTSIPSITQCIDAAYDILYVG